MTKLQELYEKLEKYSDFTEEDNIEKFLDTIDEVLLKKDPSSIKEILKYCREDCEYDIITESLPQSVLYLLDEEGVQHFLPCIKDFFRRCPSFCEEVVSILFNTKEDCEFFRQNMYLANKTSLLELFDLMKKKSPHHKELITELRAELNH